jgi:hypothetical protein
MRAWKECAAFDPLQSRREKTPRHADVGLVSTWAALFGQTGYPPLMLASLTIGHHFSMPDRCKSPSHSGVS